MSKANQTLDIEIKVTGADDIVHSLKSCIAIELLADKQAQVDMVNYLVNRSKTAIINKIEAAK